MTKKKSRITCHVILNFFQKINKRKKGKKQQNIDPAPFPSPFEVT
ncbi:hypothetical protein Q3F86_10410 [Enterococcus faecium]|nr:hypothetical protein [Enterococcus faecium]